MKKEKEIVQIRERTLKTGKTTLYLAYTINGKRRYDYPKLYLIPEKGKDKQSIILANKETKRIIKAMQSKKILELTQNRGGIEVKKEPSKMLLTDFIAKFRAYKEKTTRGKESVSTVDNVLKHLVKYSGEQTKMADVDKRFCEGFITYLRSASSKHGLPLSEVSRKVYFTMFGTMMKKAVRDGLLPQNPIELIDPHDKLQAPESNRVYLDLSEVKLMADTPCKHDLVKKAFMFSCFCGLRVSDIRQLKWSDIEEHTATDGSTFYRLSKRMQKTQRNISYSLSKEAVSWLPDKKSSHVFEGLVTQSQLNHHIKVWAEQAGITKNVSFHTARHTFATMMLTLGADIYTTSKLLGHSRIATTEIYAKIVDKKKDEAISLIDKFYDKKETTMKYYVYYNNIGYDKEIAEFDTLRQAKSYCNSMNNGKQPYTLGSIETHHCYEIYQGEVEDDSEPIWCTDWFFD